MWSVQLLGSTSLNHPIFLSFLGYSFQGKIKFFKVRGPTFSRSSATSSFQGMCLFSAGLASGWDSNQSYLYSRSRSPLMWANTMPQKLGAIIKRATDSTTKKMVYKNMNKEKPGLSKKMMNDFLIHFFKSLFMRERMGNTHWKERPQTKRNQNTKAARKSPIIPSICR